MTTTTVNKTARTVVAITTKTAATTTRGRLDLQTAMGGILTMKITNGAAVTAQAVGRVLISHNATMPAEGAAGADWKTVWQFGGGTGNGAVTEQSWEFGPSVMSLEVEFPTHTGSDVTVEAYCSEVTSVSNT